MYGGTRGFLQRETRKANKIKQKGNIQSETIFTKITYIRGSNLTSSDWYLATCKTFSKIDLRFETVILKLVCTVNFMAFGLFGREIRL